MSDHYVMESARERDRLAEKLKLEDTQQQLLRAGLAPGMRAADVGCGTHLVTDLMTEITDRAACGIDGAEHRIEAARELSEAGSEFVCCNVTKMPFGDGEFDFVWSRFLFEYLPSPEDALAEMVRVTRRGGTVVVADLDAQLTNLWPLSDENLRIHRRALEALEPSLDIYAGRRLPDLFRQVGLDDVRVTVAPHQVFAGSISEEEQSNWETKFETVRDLVVGNSELTLDEWERFSKAILAGFREGSIFYYSTLVTVSGVKRN